MTTSTWAPSTVLGKAVWAAGFSYDPSQDIIYSRMDALQRSFGYAYGYDAAAPGMSALIDCEPIFFDYDGQHWMIELWKGQYGLETGCEIGVYTRTINSSGPVYDLLDATVGQRPGDPVPSHNLFYDCAGDDDLLEMSLTLNRDGVPLFTRGPEQHWWLTGFKWGVLSAASDLTVDVSITLKDADMTSAFLGGIAGRDYPNLHVDGTTVSFTFAQTFTTQPPVPPAVVQAISAQNSLIVSTYDAMGFPNNDPNQVEAEFLAYAGLELLRLADYFGRAVADLASEAGHDIATIVSMLASAFEVAAETVEIWVSGVWNEFSAWVSAIEQYLGIPLDFSCYVEVDNTAGASDLVLVGQTSPEGSYVAAPPQWIPQGQIGRFVLQDPKPSPVGSDGSVSYRYSDPNLNVATVTFTYECPTGFLPNKAASTQPAWACFAKSGNPQNSWQHSVPSGGHPLFVGYATGGGQPT